MKITLIMPRGALYRYQTGIFKRPILYAPLTLTTLAALIPEEIGAKVEIIDEVVENLPENIEADLVGVTAITGTAKRAYVIADTIRKKGTPVVLGGVHPTLMPQEASCHADSVVTGFLETSGISHTAAAELRGVQMIKIPENPAEFQLKKALTLWNVE